MVFKLASMPRIMSIEQNLTIKLLFKQTYTIAHLECFLTRVVVKKTVHKRNRRNKACEPALYTHARQEVPKDELGTYEDPK